MNVTIEMDSDMLARLEQEAIERGQEPSVLVAQALETLFQERVRDGADAAFPDVPGMSLKTLHEYWDNDEDAIYDTL